MAQSNRRESGRRLDSEHEGPGRRLALGRHEARHGTVATGRIEQTHDVGTFLSKDRRNKDDCHSPTEWKV